MKRGSNAGKWVFIISCGLGLVIGCGSGGGGGGDQCTATTSVTVKDFAFDPSCIKVSTGDEVTWTNASGASWRHTVTSDAGAPVTFNSGYLLTAGTFTFTFTTVGTIGYHCTPHESKGMKGTVSVQ